MIHLIVSVEQIINNLNNWIVVTEATRIRINTQFVWNVNFLATFKLEDE